MLCIPLCPRLLFLNSFPRILRFHTTKLEGKSAEIRFGKGAALEMFDLVYKTYGPVVVGV